MDNSSAQKQAIADTFRKHFQHFGFKKTSVDDISDELHISKKTIYLHFNTKEEIFYFVVSQVARQYMTRMEADLTPIRGSSERISRLIHMIFQEAKKWLKGNDAFEFRYKYEIAELAFKDAYSDLMRNLLQQGMDAGEFSSVPVDHTIRMIQGMISESMRMVSTDRKLDVEEHLIQAIQKILK